MSLFKEKSKTESMSRMELNQMKTRALLKLLQVEILIWAKNQKGH